MAAIAAFDIIETDGFSREVFNSEPKAPVNENFEAIGFESVYFFENLGSFGFVLAIYVLLLIIWIMLFIMKSRFKWLDKKRKKLGNMIFWNSLIILVTESFLNVGLCAMIAFVHNFAFAPWGQSI